MAGQEQEHELVHIHTADAMVSVTLEVDKEKGGNKLRWSNNVRR